MFLDDDETQSLTGYSRLKEQMQWLRDRGYPFELGGDGKVKVLRSYVVSRLGGKSSASVSEPKLRMP